VIDWTRLPRRRSEVQVNAQLDYVGAGESSAWRRDESSFAKSCRTCCAARDLLTVEMGIAVIVEAILSFVGLSVSSDTPTWGRDDCRRAAGHLPGAALVALPIAARGDVLGLTSSATACALRSIRSSGDDRQRSSAAAPFDTRPPCRRCRAAVLRAVTLG